MQKKYGTNEDIEETKSSITRFAQQSNMTPPKYAEELAMKKLRGGGVYGEHTLNEISIVGLNASICHCMRE